MPSLREFYYSDFYQGRAQNRVCQHQHTTIFPLALSLPRMHMQAIKFQSKRTNQVVFFGISIFLLSVFLLFFLNGMFYLFFFLLWLSFRLQGFRWSPWFALFAIYTICSTYMYSVSVVYVPLRCRLLYNVYRSM